MDPNPFPPPARRGRGGNYHFANNYRNKAGANWRNHPNLEEQEEHREEVLPISCRAEPMIDYTQPEQGQYRHPTRCPSQNNSRADGTILGIILPIVVLFSETSYRKG
ncbi:unnamed protein product [Prunus armeniaca]